MARVLAYIPDLLFGSQVLAALQAAGHEVELVSDVSPAADADVLVVDLTADAAARIEAVRAQLGSSRSLAFYAHVEADVRALATQAEFDVVVPRSRMAREGAALVAKLASNID